MLTIEQIFNHLTYVVKVKAKVTPEGKINFIYENHQFCMDCRFLKANLLIFEYSVVSKGNYERVLYLEAVNQLNQTNKMVKSYLSVNNDGNLIFTFTIETIISPILLNINLKDILDLLLDSPFKLNDYINLLSSA